MFLGTCTTIRIRPRTTPAGQPLRKEFRFLVSGKSGKGLIRRPQATTQLVCNLRPREPGIAQLGNAINIQDDPRPSEPLPFSSCVPQSGLHAFDDKAALQLSDISDRYVMSSGLRRPRWRRTIKQ